MSTGQGPLSWTHSVVGGDLARFIGLEPFVHQTIGHRFVKKNEYKVLDKLDKTSTLTKNSEVRFRVTRALG